MHPILFHIFNFKLHTYGALMGAGFLAAMQLTIRRGQLIGIAELHLNRLILLSFVFGIVGARLMFVAVDDIGAYLYQPLEIFKIWKGGLVFFGGFIAAGLTMGIYAYRHKLNVLRVFDLCTPYLALAHAMGRMGCFMAGCCYGKICHLPWAVTFTDPNGVGLKNVPLHPTQVYESAFLLGAYFFCLWFRTKQRFHGMVFLIYLGIYSLGRAIIEFFRNDLRGEFWGFSTAQWISLPTLLAAIITLLILIRNRPLAKNS